MLLKKFESDRTRETQSKKKKLSMRFSIDRRIDSIDRKLHLIYPEAIEQQSK